MGCFSFEKTIKKTFLKRSTMKSIALVLWLSKGLTLASTRFVLTRIGLTDGMFREAVLIFVSAIPLVFLFISLLEDKNLILHEWNIFFLLLYMSIVLASILSLILNPALRVIYLRRSYGIRQVFLPDGAIIAFLLFVQFDDAENLQDLITRSAYIIFFYQIIMVYLPVMRRGYWLDIAPDGGMMKFSYSLSFGYDMMFPFTVFFTVAIKKKEVLHLLPALISAVLIITNGGRGAILVMILFFTLLAVTLIVNSKISFTNKMIIVSLLLTFGGIVYLTKNEILVGLIRILDNLNINSRSIEKLIDGSFSDSNGRDKIWKTVIEAIWNGGLFGYGVLGDRPIVAPLHAAGYSHNLILELLVSFGLAGVMIVIYIGVEAVRMLFFCKDDKWQAIYLILFVCSCKLLLSLSFWYSWEFWATCAIAYKYRIVKRGNKKKDYELNSRCKYFVNRGNCDA